MKKCRILALVAGLFACATINADTVTTTVSATGADAYSSAIPISGYLDRVEIVKSGDNDVVNIDVATFSGTTAIDTYVDINALATATDKVVIRPRFVGTGLSGTSLTAATAGDTGAITNGYASTVLTVPYERPLVGGNIKLKVGASAGTNATVTATFYYERLPR